MPASVPARPVSTRHWPWPLSISARQPSQSGGSGNGTPRHGGPGRPPSPSPFLLLGFSHSLPSKSLASPPCPSALGDARGRSPKIARGIPSQLCGPPLPPPSWPGSNLRVQTAGRADGRSWRIEFGPAALGWVPPPASHSAVRCLDPLEAEGGGRFAEPVRAKCGELVERGRWCGCGCHCGHGGGGVKDPTQWHRRQWRRLGKRPADGDQTTILIWALLSFRVRGRWRVLTAGRRGRVGQESGSKNARSGGRGTGGAASWIAARAPPGFG